MAYRRLIRHTYVEDVTKMPTVFWFSIGDKSRAEIAALAKRDHALVIVDEFNVPTTDKELVEFLNEHAPCPARTHPKLGR